MVVAEVIVLSDIIPFNAIITIARKTIESKKYCVNSEFSIF